MKLSVMFLAITAVVVAAAGPSYDDVNQKGAAVAANKLYLRGLSDTSSSSSSSSSESEDGPEAVAGKGKCGGCSSEKCAKWPAYGECYNFCTCGDDGVNPEQPSPDRWLTLQYMTDPSDQFDGE